MSLKAALEYLGYGPCYHMKVALTHPWQLRFFLRAKAGKKVDWRRFLKRYRSAIDWPVSDFYRELSGIYPDATVILTVRDPEEWYESMLNSIHPVMDAFPFWFPKDVKKVHHDIIWNGRFKGYFTDRTRAIDIFNQYIGEVRSAFPAERILVFDVREGWEPLCRFLGVPVPPDKEFPHKNDTRQFRRLIWWLKLANWLVPVLVVVAVGILIWFLSSSLF